MWGERNCLSFETGEGGIELTVRSLYVSVCVCLCVYAFACWVIMYAITYPYIPYIHLDASQALLFHNISLGHNKNKNEKLGWKGGKKMRIESRNRWCCYQISDGT